MSYIDVIANDKKIIGFRPELKRVIKNTNATILLQQMIYWYVINKRKPFYKFIEPCNNDKYKVGDSWSEELAFSKKEFRNALKILKDMGLITSKINMSRITFYNINEGNLDKLLSGTYVSDQRALMQVTKGHLDKRACFYTENTTENNNKDDDSIEINANTDVDFNRAFTEFAMGNKFKGSKKDSYQSYKNITIDKNLLLICIYRFLRDPDIERKVGFKKFLDDGVYLSYLPNHIEIIKDSVIYSGKYNLETYEFVNFDGKILGTIDPEALLELYKSKNINFLNLFKKAS